MRGMRKPSDTWTPLRWAHHRQLTTEVQASEYVDRTRAIYQAEHQQIVAEATARIHAEAESVRLMREQAEWALAEARRGADEDSSRRARLFETTARLREGQAEDEIRQAILKARAAEEAMAAKARLEEQRCMAEAREYRHREEEIQWGRKREFEERLTEQARERDLLLMREAESVIHNREEQVMMWKALEEREVHARAQAQEQRLRESEKEIRELKVMIAAAQPPIHRPPVFGMATPPEVPPNRRLQGNPDLVLLQAARTLSPVVLLPAARTLVSHR